MIGIEEEIDSKHVASRRSLSSSSLLRSEKEERDLRFVCLFQSFSKRRKIAAEMAAIPKVLVAVLVLALAIVVPSVQAQAPAPSPTSDGDLIFSFVLSRFHVIYPVIL